MSQENVEIVHDAFDAFNRRDSEAFVTFFDHDVKFVSRLGAVEGDYSGHEGIAPPLGQPVRRLARPHCRASRSPRGGRSGDGRSPAFSRTRGGQRRSMGVDGLASRLDGIERKGRRGAQPGFEGRGPRSRWDCRSKTLTPTPEPAGYCAGDVAGERGGRASLLRGVERREHGCRCGTPGCRRRLLPLTQASGGAALPRPGGGLAVHRPLSGCIFSSRLGDSGGDRGGR